MKNEYKILGDKTEIYITKRNGQSFKVIVDTEDLDKISHCKWCLNSAGYPYNAKLGLMYYQFMGKHNCPKKVIDHIDSNPLNNSKSNLQWVSQSKNLMKKRTTKHKNNKSDYLGVYWYPKYNKWTAQITKNKKQINLGYFSSIEMAILARQEAE